MRENSTNSPSMSILYKDVMQNSLETGCLESMLVKCKGGFETQLHVTQFSLDLTLLLPAKLCAFFSTFQTNVSRIRCVKSNILVFSGSGSERLIFSRRLHNHQDRIQDFAYWPQTNFFQCF